jgi:hypothetical protein
LESPGLPAAYKQEGTKIKSNNQQQNGSRHNVQIEPGTNLASMIDGIFELIEQSQKVDRKIIDTPPPQ